MTNEEKLATLVALWKSTLALFYPEPPPPQVEADYLAMVAALRAELEVRVDEPG